MKLYAKIIELFVSLVFGILAYFIGSRDLTDALVWFLLPIIVCMLFVNNSKESYVSKDIKDLAKHLHEIKTINPEIFGLYNAEIKNIDKKIKNSINSKLFIYSYTPDLMLYKIVCDQLMEQFNGIEERDFFYATAKCDRETVEWFFDFDQISRIFLPQLYDKLEKKQITKFYRLFIYNDIDLNDPLLWLLWFLHKKTSTDLKRLGINFQFKIIREDKFLNLTNSKTITDEMGVWGEHCVFLQKSNPQESGYSFDEEIKKLSKSNFETIWNLAEDIDFNSLDVKNIQEVNKDNKLRKEIAEKLISIVEKKDSAVINSKIDLRESSLKDIEYIQSWIKTIEPLSISTTNYDSRIF